MNRTLCTAQVQARGDRKETAALLGIDADHDVQLVDDEAGATHDLEMPARRRVERSCIDSTLHDLSSVEEL
jgi:uncharacterized membrane protein